MSDERDTTATSADKAIIEVLATERQAQEKIEAVLTEGERQLKAARMRAARIGQRADHRITQLHKLCLEKNEGDLNALRQKHHQDLLDRLAHIHPSDAVLEQAANRLALELVMSSDEDID